MSNAVLKITDGTPNNTIDLLGKRRGYLLCDWRPARPELGYTINKNWFTGTEVPASVLFKPPIDTFTFSNRDLTTDGLVEIEQDFSRILKESAMYWTGNRAIKNPYYIVAKSKNETGLRYATIFSVQLHDSGNPYRSPFFTDKPSSANLIVPITHGQWSDYPPNGDGFTMRDNVISMLSSVFTERNQGLQFLGDDSKILMPNYISHVGIMAIFRGTETINMLDGPPFYQIITDVNQEYTTIGISKLTNSSFSVGIAGIHFNITTPASAVGLDSPLFIWEAYTNSGWEEIDVYDLTESFTKPGTVMFNLAELEITEIMTKTGLWVRFRQSNLLTQRPAISTVQPAIPTLSYFDILLHGDNYNPPSSGDFPIDTYPIEDENFISYGAIDDADIPFTGSYYTVTFNSTGVVAGDVLEWIVTDPTGFQHREVSNEINVLFVPTGPFPWTEGLYSLNIGHPDGDPQVFVDSEWTAMSPYFKVAPDFSANRRDGIAGETWLQFDSNISVIQLEDHIVDRVEWILGSGISPIVGTVANHIYEEPGIYDIKMTIYFSDGGVVDKSVSVTKLAVVEIKRNVTAKFSADKRRGMAPLGVIFDASESVAHVGSIVSYSWSFGDETSSSGTSPIVERVYTSSGLYTVSLSVIDDLGNSDTVEYVNYIYVDAAQLYPGDLGMNLKLLIRPVKIPWISDLTESNSSKLYIGARSLVDPSDGLFQGFIPTYANQLNNASGVLYIKKFASSYVDNSIAYTGTVYRKRYAPHDGEPWATGPSEVEEFLTLRFSGDVADIYRGTYRMFLRLSLSYYAGVHNGDFFFSANVSTESLSDGNAQIYGGNKTREVTDIFSPDFITTLDIGSVTLGGIHGITQDLNIFFRGTIDNPPFPDAPYYFYLYDVVLIPQDEWFAEITFPADNAGGDRDIIISSLTPSGELKVIVVDEDGLSRYVPSVSPGMPLSLIGKDTRFTILSTINDRGNSDEVKFIPTQYSGFQTFHELTDVSKVNLYSGSRGSR